MNLNIRLSNVFFSALMQAAVIIISVAGVFAQPPGPEDGVWSTPIPLASADGFVGIAGSGNVVHAVYDGIDSKIMYRRSTNQGASFIDGTASSAVQIATGSVFLEDPVIADGNLVAVCFYNEFTEITDFFGPRQVGMLNIIVSTVGGSDNFQTQNPITLTTGEKGYALRHSIAIDGTNIHVVWMDFRNDKWDIYYRRSTDSGETWGTTDALLVSGANGTGDAGSGAQRPQIAANGNTIHVTWMDGRDHTGQPCDIEGSPPPPEPPRRLPQCTEIYYAKSDNDNGASFLATPAEPISLNSNNRLTTSTTTPPTYSGRPDIVTDGSAAVYVTYDKRGCNSDLSPLF